MVEDGHLAFVDHSADNHMSVFIKAIPNITTLTQVWVVYIGIRGPASGRQLGFSSSSAGTP